MKVDSLPQINEEEFDGQKQVTTPKSVYICPDHTKETWRTHTGYRYKNGILECTRCPWGTRLQVNEAVSLIGLEQ